MTRKKNQSENSAPATYDLLSLMRGKQQIESLYLKSTETLSPLTIDFYSEISEKIIPIDQFILLQKITVQNNYFIFKKYLWDQKKKSVKDLLSLSSTFKKKFLEKERVIWPKVDLTPNLLLEAEQLWSSSHSYLLNIPIFLWKEQLGSLLFVRKNLTEFSPEEYALCQFFGKIFTPLFSSIFFKLELEENAKNLTKMRDKIAILNSKLQNLEERYLSLSLNYSELKETIKSYQNYFEGESPSSELELLEYTSQPEPLSKSDELKYISESKEKTDPTIRALFSEIDDIIIEEYEETEKQKKSQFSLLCFWNLEVKPKRELFNILEQQSFRIFCIPPELTKFSEVAKQFYPTAVQICSSLPQTKQKKLLHKLQELAPTLPIIYEKPNERGSLNYQIIWHHYKSDILSEHKMLQWFQRRPTLSPQKNSTPYFLAIGENFSIREYKSILRLCCGKKLYIRRESDPTKGIEILYQNPPKLLIISLQEEQQKWHYFFRELKMSALLKEIPLILFSLLPLEQKIRDTLNHHNHLIFQKIHHTD